MNRTGVRAESNGAGQISDLVAVHVSDPFGVCSAETDAVERHGAQHTLNYAAKKDYTQPAAVEGGEQTIGVFSDVEGRYAYHAEPRLA